MSQGYFFFFKIHILKYQINLGFRSVLSVCQSVSLGILQGMMDDLQFLRPFNSISVISGLLEVDNERLCAVVPRFGFRRFSLKQIWNLEPLDHHASA